VTFIAAVATPGFVVLASDRRITTVIGDSIVSTIDRDTKAINLNGEYLMGFTGLARITGRKTEEWVVDTLADVAPELYRRVLADESAKIINWPLTPHAYLGVGFRKVSGRFVPNAWLTTNALDDGLFAPNFVDTDFTSVVLKPSGGFADLWTVGGESASPDMETRRISAIQRAREDINAIVDHNPRRPRPVMNRLAELTAQMSQFGDGSIGATALVSILPLDGIGDVVPTTWLGAVPDSDLLLFPATINYVSDFKGLRATRSYQPAIVSPGMRIWGVVSGPKEHGHFGPDPEMIA
jgi:hypothetical protein